MEVLGKTMSLSDLANIVEIVGIFAIVFGVAFGLMQLKQHRLQRRELALLECARSFEDADFTEAYRLISELPAGMTKVDLDELGDLVKEIVQEWMPVRRPDDPAGAPTGVMF